ncbi:MAG: hypothetical protein PUJ93_00695 [Oscillospiraceae bacterium]|nr:hypothetical protein [Oscillospiraceae bacterium]
MDKNKNRQIKSSGQYGRSFELLSEKNMIKDKRSKKSDTKLALISRVIAGWKHPSRAFTGTKSKPSGAGSIWKGGAEE